jgi:AcrR family transcriptional regulator
MSEIEQIRPKTPRAGPTSDTTVDRRVRRTRRQILDATVELMKSRGVDGLTMDAIAEAADVSRSTLYRHWPQLHDLLFDGLQHLGDQIGAVTTAPIEGDTFDQCVTAKALIVGQALRDDAWRSLVSTVGVAAEHNAAAAAVYDRWLTFCRDGVTEFVRGCQAAGHASADLDPEWISDLVLGPIYMHAVVLHQPMTDEQITAHVTRTQAMVSTGPPETP